jgi:hypothetical protein
VAVDQGQGAALTSYELRQWFEKGVSPEEFRSGLADGGRRLAELEALVRFDRGVSAFGRLRRPLHVLAIVEGWCRDSLDGLAVLLRLTEGRPHVALRLFIRDEHPELMAAYRKDGQYDSIPVFVFLGPDFDEIGRYIERPDEVSAMYEGHRAALAEHNPAFAPADAPLSSFAGPAREQLRVAMAELRERDRPEANERIAIAIEALGSSAELMESTES